MEKDKNLILIITLADFERINSADPKRRVRGEGEIVCRDVKNFRLDRSSSFSKLNHA